MMCKWQSFSFIIGLKSLAFILCLITFTLMMVNVWEKFNRKVSYTGIKYRYDADQRKELPCLTICPQSAMKEAGKFYCQKNVDEKSYNHSEIFDPSTWDEDNGFSEKSITYQDNLFLGRCFTICNNKKWAKKQGPNIYFKLDMDVKIFIHKRGEEFWLNGALYVPATITTTNIEISNQKGMQVASISLLEIEITHLSKLEQPCKHYSVDTSSEVIDFIECCKERMWEKFGSNFSCSIPVMKNLIPRDVEINECFNETEAELVYWNFFHNFGDFSDDPKDMSCLNRCQLIENNLKYRTLDMQT